MSVDLHAFSRFVSYAYPFSSGANSSFQSLTSSEPWSSSLCLQSCVRTKEKFHLAVFQHAAAICRPLWFQNKSVTVHIKFKTMLLFFTGKIIIRECYYRCSESLCLNVPSVFILILNFADWCFILFVLSIGNSHICYSKIRNFFRQDFPDSVPIHHNFCLSSNHRPSGSLHLLAGNNPHVSLSD